MTTPQSLTRAERKKLELRQEIIDTAFECFADRGYHATGIADIAARLGIGHGTFYRYFENKRDIVEHVVDDVFTHLLGALTAENAPDAVGTLQEYREQTERIAGAFARIVLQDSRALRLLIFEASAIDEEMRDKIAGLFGLARDMTGRYLQHGVSEGYLKSDLDVPATAVALNGMILGAAIASLGDPTPSSIDKLSAAIRRVMYDGIAQ